MTVHIGEYDEEARAAIRRCACGWSGSLHDMTLETYEELSNGCCANCGTHLVLVMYPTHEEVRRFAAAGNLRAIEGAAQLDRAGA